MSDSSLTIAGGIAPELPSPRQAAVMCGIGERTLWRWSRCGLAPAPITIGIGPRPAVRFRRADLDEWIAAGCPPAQKKGGPNS